MGYETSLADEAASASEETQQFGRHEPLVNHVWMALSVIFFLDHALGLNLLQPLMHRLYPVIAILGLLVDKISRITSASGPEHRMDLVAVLAEVRSIFLGVPHLMVVLENVLDSGSTTHIHERMDGLSNSGDGSHTSDKANHA